MTPDPAPPRTRCCGIEREEEKAWIAFYRRIHHDNGLALEILAQLDADAVLKRRHCALYLGCRQALRLHKARQARDRRIGQWLRTLVLAIVLTPLLAGVRALRHTAQRATGIGRAMRIRPAREPGLSKVDELARDPEFVSSQATYRRRRQGLSPDAASTQTPLVEPATAPADAMRKSS